MAKNLKKTLILTVVRHGETKENKERRRQGQMDTKLNETGIKQAILAGKAFKNIQFHKIYSSDLQRANKTCQLIVEQNEILEIKDIIRDPRLRERCFGIFENKMDFEYEKKAKEANLENWMDFKPENGESREEVRERIREFINDMLDQDSKLENENPSILMVTHGGVIREFFQIIFEELGCELPKGSQHGDFKKNGSIRNTCWSRFELVLCDNKIESIKCTELCNADHLNELID